MALIANVLHLSQYYESLPHYSEDVRFCLSVVGLTQADKYATWAFNRTCKILIPMSYNKGHKKEQIRANTLKNSNLLLLMGLMFAYLVVCLYIFVGICGRLWIFVDFLK